MTRNFRNFLWFVAGFALVSIPMLSRAETIPATNNMSQLGWAAGVSLAAAAAANNTRTGPTSAAACQALADVMSPCSSGGTLYQGSDGLCQYQGGMCSGVNTFGYSTQRYLCGGVSTGAGSSTSCGYTCPANQGWTLSGSNCTRPDCGEGQTRNASGQCMSVCPSAGASVGSSSSWYSGGGSGLGMCISGCSVNASTCASGFSGSGSTTGRACQGPFVATGESCSTSTAGTNGTATTNADPAAVQNNQTAINCLQSGQGYGQVNGVTVCSGPANNTTSTSKQTTTTTNPTTNTTSTNNKTTTTSCTGDSCTSTTTQTDPANPAGPGITTTQQESKNDFCKANPKDAACKSLPSEQEDYCAENPDVVGCKKLGDAPTGPEIQSQNKGVSNITPTTGGNGSCPANVALPRGAEFSYAPMCDLARGVRPVVLAIAWLIAGGMIFAWFKS